MGYLWLQVDACIKLLHRKNPTSVCLYWLYIIVKFLLCYSFNKMLISNLFCVWNQMFLLLFDFNVSQLLFFVTMLGVWVVWELSLAEFFCISACPDQKSFGHKITELASKGWNSLDLNITSFQILDGWILKWYRGKQVHDLILNNLHITVWWLTEFAINAFISDLKMRSTNFSIHDNQRRIFVMMLCSSEFYKSGGAQILIPMNYL